MTEKRPYVYIMSSKRNGTLYIGVTSNLPARVWSHKNDMSESFTKKYKAHTLVCFEEHGEMLSAIEREKQIKAWKRKWKLAIIEKHNPRWNDLYEDIVG
ncbi:GIY-YIG nuclease family protein [Candidatus Spongiihabitans sp.]|uniref:GIY-YIG nuclease family protein n=1 Tax=Candidatus Spongiihabitans sp. TaxID=3101308 RepID=UPI003C7AAD46